MLLALKKMRIYSSRSDDVSVAELLQNVNEYCHVFIREPYLFCIFTLEVLLKWCTDRLFLKWPRYSPDLIYVL